MGLLQRRFEKWVMTPFPNVPCLRVKRLSATESRSLFFGQANWEYFYTSLVKWEINWASSEQCKERLMVCRCSVVFWAAIWKRIQNSENVNRWQSFKGQVPRSIATSKYGRFSKIAQDIGAYLCQYKGEREYSLYWKGLNVTLALYLRNLFGEKQYRTELQPIEIE